MRIEKIICQECGNIFEGNPEDASDLCECPECKKENE